MSLAANTKEIHISKQSTSYCFSLNLAVHFVRDKIQPSLPWSYVYMPIHMLPHLILSKEASFIILAHDCFEILIPQ